MQDTWNLEVHVSIKFAAANWTFLNTNILALLCLELLQGSYMQKKKYLGSQSSKHLIAHVLVLDEKIVQKNKNERLR